MRFSGLGLQGKFVIALFVSAVLPFLVGLAIFETSGFRHLLSERGKLHYTEARHLAAELDQTADELGGMLQTWLAADPALMEFVSTRNRELEQRAPDEVASETIMLDEVWPSLTPSDGRLSAVLANPGAESLQRFGSLHPEVAEVLVTDVQGRLIAATNKSSDYNQADEEWWRKGAALGKRGRWTDVLRFDASSRVFSLDVVVPLHDDGALAGVVKMSMDVSSLFKKLGRGGAVTSERWEVVLADGRVLARSKVGFVALQETVTPQTLAVLNRDGGGWFLESDGKGGIWMTGFTPIGSVDGLSTAHILLSSRREDVVGPLQKRFLQIGAAAAAVLLCCTYAGFHLVRRDILQPLSVLRKAARSVSASAGLRWPEKAGQEPVGRDLTTEHLENISRIRTGDEIEALAADLGAMSRRVLSYQRELEDEVASKTSVIHEELELARQFQRALLPARYPEIPPDAAANPLRLRFAHFYQSAFTVGGDFFDLIELDANRAGILIADVMGHGARSALVTAILRALVRNHAADAGDPGKFLADLNSHLHEIIQRSGQTLFVTAFFLVLDTREGRASWAVAGHPAPLRARRGSGHLPAPLWAEPHHQPALGLVAEASFQTQESELHAGDVFLLFTDGASEAENPAGEIFGIKRLAESFDQALDGPMAAMPAKIVCDVSAFQCRQAYEDDVCILVVEAASR
jgi:serine phosphatase RsbU (regulator of sigma subunit)